VNQAEISVTTFEALRGRLFGLAYRMLGSRADAEDVVQETYLRWHQVPRGSIESPEAWLVTTTSRLAIDRLRRLKTEREAYVGQWLPEPIVTQAPPDRDLDLAADLSIAFLTLLERLAPGLRNRIDEVRLADPNHRRRRRTTRAEQGGLQHLSDSLGGESRDGVRDYLREKLSPR
jgi:DNA-directed RNA polymerase specialized sigma24 family protein